jgi:aminoglycoside phosphotransferase (APT) family kinase protein
MIETTVDEGRVEGTDGEFCLWHSDLFPRNIMVDVDSSPMITGIIDWDEAVYAPKFVDAVAPTWLWVPREGKDDEEEEEVVVEEVPDDENETYDRAWEVPPSDELRQVRRAFATAAGKECVDSCTDHYAIFARRILRFALEWQWPYWWHEMYRETVEEWEALREEDDDEEGEDSDEDSNGGSEDSADDNAEDGDDSDEDGGMVGGSCMSSEAVATLSAPCHCHDCSEGDWGNCL